MDSPNRPLLRWHGGKWRLAPWIIQHFPKHKVYVEPFGGAGSVLLRKPRSYHEVYNDLDDDVVNLFRVLRRPEDSARLVDLLRLTPWSRVEFFEAYGDCKDPVERARHLVVRAFMGFGSDAHNGATRTGFRVSGIRAGTTPPQDWVNYPDALQRTIERLRGVIIENRDAREIIAQQDIPECLFYVDPPYMPETRSPKSRKRGEKYHAYAHEMSASDHVELLASLRAVAGMVVLSGYPSETYEVALTGWHRVERAAMADGAKPRTEVLWINPLALERLEQERGIFGVAA